MLSLLPVGALLVADAGFVGYELLKAMLPRLHRAIQDDHQCKTSKRARDWPHKKRTKPPGEPKLHQATRAQIEQARAFEKSIGHL